MASASRIAFQTMAQRVLQQSDVRDGLGEKVEAAIARKIVKKVSKAAHRAITAAAREKFEPSIKNYKLTSGFPTRRAITQLTPPYDSRRHTEFRRMLETGLRPIIERCRDANIELKVWFRDREAYKYINGTSVEPSRLVARFHASKPEAVMIPAA